MVRARRCWPGSTAPTRSCSSTIFLRQLKAMGFSGVQNFPTVGLIDGTFRQNLEETGMGYGLEVELIRAPARSTC